MSEDFDFSKDGEGEDAEGEEFVPDPATIAFLDQEAAAFAEVADEFAEVYGFVHNCHCDEDYAAGRVGEVTECYAGMIVESLAACAKLNHENKQLKNMVQALMEMNTAIMEGTPKEDDVEDSEAGSDNLGESGTTDHTVGSDDLDIERFDGEANQG